MNVLKVGDRVQVKPVRFNEELMMGNICNVVSTGVGNYYHVRLDDGRRVSKYDFELHVLQSNRDAALVGLGGAPTRATTLPTEAKKRKEYPVASGFVDYFPDAICAVANLSHVGNEQHNPGQPLHWARGKSGDEADTMLRHFLQRGTLDTDGVRHTVKAAWRMMALLQKELEAEMKRGETIASPSGVNQERCL